MHAYIANVIGDNLVTETMNPGDLPTRPVADQPVMVLYGEPDCGITVGVAATSFEEAQSILVQVYEAGLGAYVDCIDDDINQSPLWINMLNGYVPKDKHDAAWRLLQMDSEVAR